MISIITPARNAESCIKANLAAMSQQEADFEHIVQDGQSADATVLVCRSFRQRYNIAVHSEADRGIYDAVARGVEKSQGNILAWLGADDCYTPWALAFVEEIFRVRKDVDWITGIPCVSVRANRPIVFNNTPFPPVYMRFAIRLGWYRVGRLGTLQQESMFWRRSLWEKAKGADCIRKYRYAGDYHLWRAFAVHAPLFTVGSVLAVAGLSHAQTSSRFACEYEREVTGNLPKMVIRRPALYGRVANLLCSSLLFRRVIIPGRNFVDTTVTWLSDPVAP